MKSATTLKKIITLVLPPLVFMFAGSCSGSGSNQNDQQADTLSDVGSKPVWVKYHSEVRPHLDSFDLTAIYTDTLVFDHFDSNYDYWYAFFTTNSGEQVAMAYDEVIQEYGTGSVFAVNWELDSLWEAGEGDVLYYKERLISFEVLENVPSFSSWLQDGFIKDLLKNDQKLMKKYIHPNQKSLFLSYNPGAFCILSDYYPERSLQPGDGYSVLEGKPSGDFCEGYPGVTNGFYYEDITESEFPGYADMTDLEVINSYTPPLPVEVVDRVIKVWVIFDEFHDMYLYFVQVDGAYYLWIEDFCDCSA